MILIADSGSTKTDWSVVENGEIIKSIPTKGINPFYQTEQEITEVLKTSLLPEVSGYSIESVFFRQVR